MKENKQKKYKFEDLKNIRFKRIELKRLERNILEHNFSTYQSPTISDTPGSNSIKNKVEDNLLKQIELEQDYKKYYNQLFQEILDLEKIIDSIEEGFVRLVLRYFYLDGKSIEQIAVELSFSYAHIKRIKKKGIYEFIAVCER